MIATKIRARARAVETFLLTEQLAPYGVAMSRILAGAAYLGILLTNFPVRQLLFGAASDWNGPLREHDRIAPWAGILAHLPGPVFTLVYLVVIALGIAFVLGWHTRVAGVLFLFGVIQILEMNPLVSDQGDNILRIGVLFLLLTECGSVWSLDARRGLPSKRSHARTLMHNAAVIALGIQVVTVYIAAAMFKIPGIGWREGTAIAYPLRSDAYQVWPFLNDLVTSSGVLVWAVTYAAVFLQLYFPVLLLNRSTRRVALGAIIGLHLGIAVLMGLPWFTLAMVAFDGIFVSTSTYLTARRLLDRLLGRWLGRLPWRVS
ncbi:MAG: HTTM domain-containing protein [Propionibacteriales bacterium]|nr:HTTM domain-containing protein [Propionibacteriales bacterium]